MSTKVIRPEQFQAALLDAMKDYSDKVLEVTEQASKKVSRATVKTLKGSAPAGGRYASGWSHKAQKDGVSKYSETVYNRTDYQLTHLLEKPHSTGRKRGGHYPKKVDYTGTIARVEEQYNNQFMEEVMNKL